MASTRTHDDVRPSPSSLLTASAAALATFAVWWVGVAALDGFLARTFPYEWYSRFALLYPEIYYPGFPGWLLASAQPYSAGVWVAAVGWMVLLSVAVGVASTRVVDQRSRSPVVTAVAMVTLLFVVVTSLEAFAALFL